MQSIKAKAGSLLSRRAHFTKELREKLRQRGYPLKEIEPLLQQLTELGYLDDKELAKSLIEKLRRKGYGAKVIAYKLFEKAGSLNIEIEESDEGLERLIQTRYLKDLLENREKVIRALLRRGYPYSLIEKHLP